MFSEPITSNLVSTFDYSIYDALRDINTQLGYESDAHWTVIKISFFKIYTNFTYRPKYFKQCRIETLFISHPRNKSLFFGSSPNEINIIDSALL